MEPFTLEEETGLVDKLDALSVASLESYIASARAALGNNALAATWRPRIEFGSAPCRAGADQGAGRGSTRSTCIFSSATTVAASKSRKAAAPVADEESEQTADEG